MKLVKLPNQIGNTVIPQVYEVDSRDEAYLIIRNQTGYSIEDIEEEMNTTGSFDDVDYTYKIIGE